MSHGPGLHRRHLHPGGGGDRRTFQVTLALQAQGVLRREVTAPILTDLYSTTHTLETTEAMYPICRLLDQGEAQESARETVETSSVPSRLLDVQVRLGRLTQNLEGEDRVLTQEAGFPSCMRPRRGLPAPAAGSPCLTGCPARGGTCLVTTELLQGPHPLPWQGGGGGLLCPSLPGGCA